MIPISFCPRCGHVVEDRKKYGKIRPVCPQCHYIHFADPKVAAVVFVERTQNDVHQVLLVKRSVEPQRGFWALPAGYVDRGEDPKSAAVREAAEETGLQVEITRLIDVYFNASGTIAIVYAARLIGGTLRAQDDAADARWFAPDALPPLAFESTQQLVVAWAERVNHP